MRQGLEMNFSYNLPAILIGAAVVVVQPQLAVALTAAEVGDIAKEFTVRIDGDGFGSGVIFERKGDTYYVFTNRHVVYKDGRYEIQTSDGISYPVYYSQELPGLDLVVLEFKSNKNYRVADLGNSDQVKEGMTVYVVGWAGSLPGIEERSYQVTDGRIRSRLQNPKDGYALVYNNEAIPGMSGGPILDENSRVVGINGQATQEGNTGTVLRLGIPINTFLAARNNLRSPTTAQKPSNSATTTTVQQLSSRQPTTAQKPSNSANTTTPQQTARVTSTATRQSSVEELISLGGSKANRGDYRGAITNYDQALQINSNNPYAYFQRGTAYYQLGNKQAAIEDFNQVLRINPNNALAYFSRGYTRYNLKDYQGAISDYTQAIRLKPDDADVYLNRGLARYDLKEYKEAIADYNQAIRLNPNYSLAYYNRGIVLYDQKDYQGALADYNQAIRLQPDDAFAYLNRGLTRYNLKDDQGALADYGQVIRLKPDYANAYYNRGIVLYNQKDYKGASADFTQAIRLQPNDAFAYFRRGLARYNLKDDRGAISDYTSTLR